MNSIASAAVTAMTDEERKNLEQGTRDANKRSEDDRRARGR